MSAKDTEKAMEQLCLGYADVTRNSTLPELASIAFFILDFLCIHPFIDGNGCVSRLLTTLLLHQHHFEVGKYISIEKLIENGKDDYYRVLAESSENWHTGEHQVLPWLNYLLSIIKMAYQDLKEKVVLSTDGDNQSLLIKQTILSFNTPFSISDIQNIHPSISRDLIKKVSSKLRGEKQIESTGRGRSAKWIIVQKNQVKSRKG